ncbi:MAG: GntR family transcriptional regulator [Petrimonas sp.]|jgi:DNA-binding transcriptional regulator YhcF (GntR family)|nr:MAG: DNA-binding transcriptional repressor MngR [Bacteroidetes bacterium ADurb.BinA174]
MELKFNNKNTKVKQLADYIQRAISLNELMPGDKLSSINTMSRQHKISRDTVFKAFNELKARGLVESIHGKNYFVSNQIKNVLLILDEYTPFKDVLYNTLVSKLPTNYKIDLWFHQYNEHLFNNVVQESYGMYNKYLIMNYSNEMLAESLLKIDPKKLLLLDFGKFDKEGYSYICQDFDQGFYDALNDAKEDFRKYKKIVFLFDKRHKHPQSSKTFLVKFCLDNNFEFEIIDSFSSKTPVNEGTLYIVIKQTDVVEVIKRSKIDKLKVGKDFGLIGYNNNPFYEVIESGIASISIDWEEMGSLAADFVTNGERIACYLPTKIIQRNSY